jgi:hypothetical protein
LLDELEPYVIDIRLKFAQQKQSSYTFIKKTERDTIDFCWKTNSIKLSLKTHVIQLETHLLWIIEALFLVFIGFGKFYAF